MRARQNAFISEEAWSNRAIHLSRTEYTLCRHVIEMVVVEVKESIMRRYRILSAPALAVALAGSNIMGCGDAASPVSDNAAPVALDEGECADFHGNKHCPLGGAKLDRPDDTVLNITGLRDADKDGVAILLREVSSFVPEGRI